MKKGLGIVLGVIGAIVLLVVIYFGTQNSLIRSKEEVQGAYATIDVQLQRRSDLIPNLVSTVKGFATHEEDVIKSVTDARAKIGSSQTPTDRLDAETELSGALSRLLVVVENYPDLKADANFRQLSDELAGTENRIAVARKDYNDTVKSYNVAIKSFPKSIVAGILGYKDEPYFEAAASAKEVPVVDFSK